MEQPERMQQNGDTYTLWHIPSSTLLVVSGLLDEIADRLGGALDQGCTLADFMLQVTGRGELIGHQLLGVQIMDAITGRDAIDESSDAS